MDWILGIVLAVIIIWIKEQFPHKLKTKTPRPHGKASELFKKRNTSNFTPEQKKEMFKYHWKYGYKRKRLR